MDCMRCRYWQAYWTLLSRDISIKPAVAKDKCWILLGKLVFWFLIADRRQVGLLLTTNISCFLCTRRMNEIWYKRYLGRWALTRVNKLLIFSVESTSLVILRSLTIKIYPTPYKIIENNAYPPSPTSWAAPKSPKEHQYHSYILSWSNWNTEIVGNTLIKSRREERGSDFIRAETYL